MLRRIRFTTALACGISTIVVAPALAQTVGARTEAGAAQNLSTALKSIARQTGTSILFRETDVAGVRSPAIPSGLTALEAVRQIIADTDLEVSVDEAGGLTVRRSADQAGTATSEVSSSSEELADIVVTARAKEENLQRVPVSAQVLTGETLKQRNYNSLTDIAETTPGLFIRPGFQNNTIYIRGIGTGGNPLFDQSVGTFADGVFRGRSRVSDALFFDMGRVEVLKGPQSTYFGNNASAGAINLITRKPGDHFEFDARGLYGMFGHYATEAALGGPLTDTLGIRVSGTFNGIKNGWVKNLKTGRGGARQRNYGGRIILAYQPADTVDMTLKVEGGDHRLYGAYSNLPLQWISCPAPAPLPPGTGGCGAALAAGVPIGTSPQDYYSASGSGVHLDNFESVLTTNVRFGEHKLTSISAYSHYAFDSAIDDGLLPTTGTTYKWPESYNQYSQELRFSSPEDQALTYMLGGYYQRGELATGYDINLNQITVGPGQHYALRSRVSQNEDVASLFGTIGYRVTDKLKLNLGLRQLWVTKHAKGLALTGYSTQVFGGFQPNAPTPGQPAPPTVPTNFDYKSHPLLPSANLQYQVTPAIMAYANYSKPYKSGGVNAFNPLTSLDVATFKAERGNAYELGLKSRLFDNRVQLNLAIFRTDYKDQQALLPALTTVFVTQTPLTGNIAGVRAQGGELELQWQVTPRFKLGAYVLWNEGKYTDYKTGQPTALMDACNGAVFYAANTAACAAYGPPPQAAPRQIDYTGKRLLYSPRWSGNLDASYTMPVAGGYEVTGAINSYWASAGATFDDVYKGFDPYIRFDARLTLASPDRHWSFDLIGKNMTNSRGVQPNVPKSFVLEPRNIAVQVRMSF